MPRIYITGHQLREMLVEASALLDKETERINALNVFPVPDGDTGTNMNLTLKAAVYEVQKTTETTVTRVAEAAARGSLMGARGNSGVILSQLIRGISLGLAGKEQATPTEFARALEKGVDIAYKAVMKPVEGTILTVAREATRAAVLASYKETELINILKEACKTGQSTLDKTPEMLLALKQAGVVDAGGKGLLVIYQGFLAALQKSDTEIYQEDRDKTEANISQKETVGDFTYCTEFLVYGKDIPVEGLKKELAALGDSLMVVGSEEMLKVHVHTNNPGLALEICLKKGTLHEIHINNMQDQIDNKNIEKKAAEKPFGLVAVAMGNGLNEIFTSLGADEVVSGGQTMNPSTEDLLKAVENVPAQRIFLLPNNKNIILAAQQVGSLTSKEVMVIPTRTLPQGISAMLSYEQNSRFSINAEKMLQNMDKVLTGEVTTAARDSQYGSFDIKAGDILGINEGEITVTGKNTGEVTRQLISSMLGSSRELVTLYYGNNIKKGEAEELLEELTEKYPEIEFELHYGGQPNYFYLISVE